MADASAGTAAEDAIPEKPSSHNILTIPPEVFERIAEEADPEVLLALRLVSKETDERVFRTHLKTHFSERAFLLSSEDSLRTLLAISENETFARALDTVELCIDDIPSEDHPCHVNRTRAPLHELTLRERIQRTQQDPMRKFICERQEQFRQRDGDLHLLTIIFSRFKLLDHDVEVKVVDKYEACECPNQQKTLEALSGQELIWTEDDQRPVTIVLEALALSGLRIDAFTTRFDNFGWPIHALTDTPQRAMYSTRVFQHLKKLHLNTEFEHSAPSVNALIAFANLMSSASLIEDLLIEEWTLPWRESHPHTYDLAVRGISQCLRDNFPALKLLIVQGFDIPQEELVSIIERHPKLEELHFHAHYTHNPYAPVGVIYAAENDDLRFPTVFEWESCEALGGILIPPCTAIELEHGKTRVQEVIHEMHRWSAKTSC